MIPESCVASGPPPGLASLRAMTTGGTDRAGRGLAGRAVGSAVGSAVAAAGGLGLLLWGLFAGGHAVWAGWRLRDSGGGGTFRLFSVTNTAADGTRMVHEPWLLVYRGSAGMWRGWIEGAVLIALGVLVCVGPRRLRGPAAVMLVLAAAVWAIDIARLLAIDLSLLRLAWPALLAAGIGVAGAVTLLARAVARGPSRGAA